MAARFGLTIICDRVYIDMITNKSVIAGMYGGDIRMAGIPGTLDISTYVEIWSDAPGSHQVVLEAKVNGEPVAGMGGIVIIGDSLSGPATLASPPMQIHISEPGTLELSGKIDGGKSKRLIVKKVIKNPTAVAIASPPPS